MYFDFSASAAGRIEAIDAAAATLRAVAPRLMLLASHARNVSFAADWEAPSARAFGDRSADLASSLSSAVAAVDTTVASLRRAAANIALRPPS